MLILGLMWVASWFSGVPGIGSKLLDTPKYLAYVLSSTATSKPPLPTTPHSVLGVARTSAIDSQLRSALDDALTPTLEKRDPQSLNSNPSIQENWMTTIEALLFAPDASSDQDAKRPITQFFNTVQNAFWTVPIVAAASDDANSLVSIIEVNQDGHASTSEAKSTTRFGFWRCPTWQSSPSELTAKRGFQIWVKGCQIATLPNRNSAETMAQSVRRLLADSTLDASKLRNTIVNNAPGAALGEAPIFSVSDRLAARIGRPAELLAIEWLNNLRIALGQPSVSLVEAQIQMHELQATNSSIGGMASWYGPYFHGRQTANGEIFNQNDLTAAHPTLPLGTFLKVTNRANGESVIVRVNDRGPYFDNRVLDLSKRAAKVIGSEEKGVVQIEAVVMQSPTIAQSKPPRQVARLITGY